MNEPKEGQPTANRDNNPHVDTLIGAKDRLQNFVDNEQEPLDFLIFQNKIEDLENALEEIKSHPAVEVSDLVDNAKQLVKSAFERQLNLTLERLIKIQHQKNENGLSDLTFINEAKELIKFLTRKELHEFKSLTASIGQILDMLTGGEALKAD